MEKKVNVEPSKLKKEETKFKVNIKGNRNLKLEFMNFYNEKIKKMHIILLVIAVVLYIATFYTTFSSIKAGNYSLSDTAVAPSFMDNIKENTLLYIVIIVAGITPYCFLSIIGMAQPIMYVDTLAMNYVLNGKLTFALFLGGLIQMISITLCIALGLYYCRLSTKKNKYYHVSDFGMNDIKMQIYEIRKDEKKVEEIKKKKEEKNKKIQECNVKIPYLSFIALWAVAFVIQFIGVLITRI